MMTLSLCMVLASAQSVKHAKLVSYHAPAAALCEFSQLTFLPLCAMPDIAAHRITAPAACMHQLPPVPLGSNPWPSSHTFRRAIVPLAGVLPGCSCWLRYQCAFRQWCLHNTSDCLGWRSVSPWQHLHCTQRTAAAAEMTAPTSGAIFVCHGVQCSTEGANSSTCANGHGACRHHGSLSCKKTLQCAHRSQLLCAVFVIVSGMCLSTTSVQSSRADFPSISQGRPIVTTRATCNSKQNNLEIHVCSTASHVFSPGDLAHHHSS